MGIDSCGVFYTRFELSDERLELLNKKFERRHYTSNVKFVRGGHPKRYIIDYDLARFYGVGYERADFESVIAPLAFLRRQSEVSEVYYWGDCGEEEDAQLFDDKLERKLVEHWLSNGYPYRIPYDQRTNAPERKGAEDE